jgi:hypothetical protein
MNYVHLTRTYDISSVIWRFLVEKYCLNFNSCEDWITHVVQQKGQTKYQELAIINNVIKIM